MNPPTVGTKFFRPGRLSVTLLVGAVFSIAACVGSDSSGEASHTASEGAGPAASAGAGSTAPLGTGFIMVSELSQLHLTEATYLEELDCAARVSALGDAEAYQGCLEVPRTAICLQLTEGFRESDSWWECFVKQKRCEDATARHEVVMQIAKGIREILRRCAETEMASVFASV